MSLTYDPLTGVFARNGRSSKRFHTGYYYVRFEGRLRLAHRLAWYLTHGYWPKADIDHINGNRADNRICNLREATRSQNLANRPCMNATGYKGVLAHRDQNRKKRFGAQVTKNGKAHFFGWYETAQEAGAVYAREAARLHGEFART